MLCQVRFATRFALALFVVCSAVLATAQVSHTDFSSVADLTLKGAAAQATSGNNQVLRLTPDTSEHVSGTAWATSQQSISNGFTTAFTFQITHDQVNGPGPADGLAFVIQNSHNEVASGLNALGGSGGALGYGVPLVEAGDSGTPIDNSLAIEVDTFQNAWDPDGNHIAVQSCGTGTNSQDHSATFGNSPCNLGLVSNPRGVNLADGQPHTLFIQYDPGSLRIWLDDPASEAILDIAVTLSDLLSLNPQEGGAQTAFVGFSGATGLYRENNDILSWTFSPGTTTTTITQSLPQVTNQTTDVNYVYGSYNHKVEYSTSTSENDVSVTAIPIDQLEFHNTRLAGSPFSDANCVIYQGTGGKCVLFRVQCTEGNDCSTLDYSLFNNFNTDTIVTNPGVLKATIGQNNWVNIIQTFVQSRLDPGTKSGTKGFSDFIVVQGATAAPSFTNVSPANGATYFVGQTIPVSFQCNPDSSAPLVTLESCSGSLTVPGQGTTNYTATTPVPNTNALSFSGGPVTFTQTGSGSFNLSASDSVMNSSSLPVSFTVGTLPAFTSPNSVTFTQGVFGTFTPTATGTPTPTITKTAGNLPTGVSFTNGVLSGTPTQSGTFPLTLTASNAAGNTPQSFTLIVLGPQATISPTALNFGTVKFLTLWAKNVTVKNIGTQPLKINGVQVIQGTSDWDDYFFVNLCPSSLGAGKSCTITVFFLADDLGLRTATLNVYNNSGVNPLQVSLTGTVKK